MCYVSRNYLLHGWLLCNKVVLVGLVYYKWYSLSGLDISNWDTSRIYPELRLLQYGILTGQSQVDWVEFSLRPPNRLITQIPDQSRLFGLR